jgi:dTDP-4-amino-4,6-dideoxygalactose transaminase
MDVIMDIASKYNLYVVEDAAQGMMSTYKGRPLGTIGHIGAYSFHETKNYTSAGEGGLLILNDEKFVKRAEIIREKGTNRTQFFRGMVDKYSWVDIGSSYLLNDVSAAYLWGNLEKSDKINKDRTRIWNKYYSKLKDLEGQGLITLPTIPKDCIHNAHMFYLKVKDLKVRTSLIKHLKLNDILSVFHYIPLHSSKAGLNFGEFNGTDQFTTRESERLIRLPIYYGLKTVEVNNIINTIKESYDESK